MCLVGRVLPLVGVRLADSLGQVLGEVADRPLGVGSASEQSLHVELAAEPDHVRRLRILVVLQLRQRIGPGLQRYSGARVQVVEAVPLGQLVHIHRTAHLGPPDLVVGRPRHLLDDRRGGWRHGSRRGNAVPADAVPPRLRSTALCSRHTAGGSGTSGREASGSAGRRGLPGGSRTRASSAVYRCQGRCVRIRGG